MNYIIAILVFGLLIFVHELGHFVVAKLSGITVLQFTIGFGPAVFKKQVGETLYAVRLLPLGGAVMMQGEEDEETEKLLTGDPLGEVEERLPPELFFRSHRSYIINLEQIDSIAPYGRWTHIVRLRGTREDALITHEKFEELEKRFQ